MIARAAALEGDDLSRFVVDAAMHRAKAVIQEHGFSTVTEGFRRRFYDLLLNPPNPTQALIDLAKSPVPEGFELEK